MLLVLLAAAAAQSGGPQVPPSIDSLGCNRELARAAARDPAPRLTPPLGLTPPRRLDRLPPGQLQLAVDKRVAGCSVTVLPTRDANGNRLMILRDSEARLQPTDGRRSRPQGRPERQR